MLSPDWVMLMVRIVAHAMQGVHDLSDMTP